MAKQFEKIDEKHKAFIEKQPVFFVASAAAGSRINLSPKGLDCLRVIDTNTICYLDLTGSGSETSAHLLADGRLTVMFCAFEGPPMILRLYGHARSVFRETAEYGQLLAAHYGNDEPRGARQIVVQAIDLVQTSCGFAVPFMDFVAERPTLSRYWDQKDDAEIIDYRASKNMISLDGLPTGMEKAGGMEKPGIKEKAEPA